MMGQHDRSEALFYYFRLEDQVPETHLLRLIDKHISFEFVRERLKDSYSDTGRPSIDPELLHFSASAARRVCKTHATSCIGSLNSQWHSISFEPTGSEQHGAAVSPNLFLVHGSFRWDSSI